MTRQQQQYFLLHQDLLTFVVALRYLPIGGLKEFNQVSVKLAYGDNSPAIQDARVAAVQSLSGTGSCRLFAEFMHRYLPGAAVCIPKPTWANHHNIFRDAQVEQRGFRYYKPDTRGLDFEGLMEDLQVGQLAAYLISAVH